MMEERPSTVMVERWPGIQAFSLHSGALGLPELGSPDTNNFPRFKPKCKGAGGKKNTDDDDDDDDYFGLILWAS